MSLKSQSIFEIWSKRKNQWCLSLTPLPDHLLLSGYGWMTPSLAYRNVSIYPQIDDDEDGSGSACEMRSLVMGRTISVFDVDKVTG